MNTRRNWSSRRRVPPGKGAARLALLSVAAAFLLVTGAAARPAADAIQRVVPLSQGAHYASRPAARAETLWIFDADFEDLLGDNAGWTSYDRSESVGHVNYWHKDTIRINGFEWLGDSTWWCGTYDNCWRQPRGYGNDWLQILERNFTEASGLTGILTLEFDQRYAMEQDYDYGYVDIRSSATADTWLTVETMDNCGFTGTPGRPVDWDMTSPPIPPGHPLGHVTLDITDEGMGVEFDLRFRFESDGAYSSQDQWDNTTHSVLDGAWQLDNIKLVAWTPDSVLVFLDDCESPGDNGWAHESIPASGQTGVIFTRGVYGTDFWTGRTFSCGERHGWMYAAVDPLTSKMVDGEYAWLMSPPIDIAGAERLVGQWDAWVDFPRLSGDLFNLYLSVNDSDECVVRPACFVDESPGWWYTTEPGWDTWTDDWSHYFTGRNWLALMWAVMSDMVPPPEEDHMGGLFLDRQRVGVVTGEMETRWSYSGHGSHSYPWTDGRFNDWFEEQITQALLDSAYVKIDDEDGITSAFVLASNDSGATWEAYEMLQRWYGSDPWMGPPPINQMTAGSEILYYFEAIDGLGNASTYPPGAPDECFEFSVLPLRATTTEPGILIVDKYNTTTPGEDRRYGHSSEYYYREMLEVLGHDYEVFHVEFPGWPGFSSWGPDTLGMKYYDTQIWITSDSREPTLKPIDQANLIAWLAQASEGRERNLLLSGNNIGHDLVVAGAETLGFYSDWLASEYVCDGVGVVTTDSLPALRNYPAGFDFMTHDDNTCILRGGCPSLGYFDVIQPSRAVAGVEIAVEYVKEDMTSLSAGVAFTDTSGYQTVTLGFGMEFMSHALLPDGHYAPGVSDRVDLMANIMEYFGKAPTGPGTGTEDNEVFVTKLSQARPNPFNPSTTIAYSLAGRSRVTIRVYDLTGRVVRTLVDGEAEAGKHVVTWDGTTDSGERAASSVYFLKMEGSDDAGRFSEVGKAVMLK